MTPSDEEPLGLTTQQGSRTGPLQDYADRVMSDLIASLADPAQVSPGEQRRIIARYAALLEGNLIGRIGATDSDGARTIIEDPRQGSPRRPPGAAAKARRRGARVLEYLRWLFHTHREPTRLRHTGSGVVT